ncbi:uncharacterized protein BJ212DRAFT_1449906 [Suillus subaureus]|uniref:C2H2-type domain-containing protein n=1 Tax=Suillus subaureus TaxID=48587 RepID=A0A9P7DUE5_9AGAM|nr:uncharacterized protein BJ212DRAFT_1449906 [Suillus subaureus]KAG1803414.1 hypothetical protein BJ212DRAFT_1449906 [Suillus subaureus]
MPNTIPCSHSCQQDHSTLQLPCGSCRQYFKTPGGQTKHHLSAHPAPPIAPQATHQHSPEPMDVNTIKEHENCPEFDVDIEMDEPPHHTSPQPDVDAEFFGPGDHLYRNYHMVLDGRLCDANGVFLPPGAPPLPPNNVDMNDWTPFRNHMEFEMAKFLYTQNQMPAGQIDRLLDLWASTLVKHGDKPPFADHRDLYQVIDSSPLRDVKWQSFTVAYDGKRPENDTKPWMDDKYDVWYHDPHNVVHNMRQWKDFMSGDWAWDQADEIAKDPSTLGSTFVPVILGSDKTTVSIGTGNNEYYLLYASIGNIHNNEHAGEPAFRKFHQQLFHSSLSKILESLKPGMTTPEVVCFGDGPYIADYEEQVLLACIVHSWCPKCMAPSSDLDQDALCCCRSYTEALIEEGTSGDLWDNFGIVSELVPFTNDFPRANNYQMILPDILHQLVKGAFKDHLVDWVEKYLKHYHLRIAAVASFAGLRQFPQGCGFKQWTGDDSKALMKVYLPAIEGHVPKDVVWAFRALLEFCYLVRCNIISEDALVEIEDALSRFHHYREVFKMTGIIPTFSLPCQHSLKHYVQNIQLFAAPNSLCSSITKNKHIKAALGQMLLTNQWLDKLAGMLSGTCLSAAMDILAPINIDEDLEINNGPTVLQAFGKKCTQTIPALAEELNIPCLPKLLHPDDPHEASDIRLSECPHYLGKISVINSVYLSGIGGMCTEHIHSCPSWWKEHLCHDCVFINTDPDLPGMQGLDVAHGELYPCVVICWFNKFGDMADEDTGMWVIHPSHVDGVPEYAVIHIDSIFQAAHLIPVYGTEFVPQGLKFYHSYDAFQAYYMNKYADHHAFESAI